MKKFAITLTAILSCTFCFADDCWGVLTVLNSKPVAYSIKKIDLKNKMTAIGIDGNFEKNKITLVKSKMLTKSPLFDSENNSTGWSYVVNAETELPEGKIWIIVPSEWKIKKIIDTEIILEDKNRKKHSITITRQSEGFTIKVKSKKHEESGYYYLGYDIM